MTWDTHCNLLFAQGSQSKRCLGCRWVEFREEVLKLENGREVLFSGRVSNADVPWITDRIKSIVEVCHSIHSVPSSGAPGSHRPMCWSYLFTFPSLVMCV